MNPGELAGARRVAESSGKAAQISDPSPESLSLLALRLRGDLQPQDRGRSLLVTAADDDAAALETTLELAWRLAEELGQTVLLIDSAFGDRSMSEALGLADAPGLAECLDAAADAESLLPQLTRPTQHPRIFSLPQGEREGPHTIRGKAIQELVGLACRRHDFVLVRTSLQADLGRALAFCSSVDAAFLLAIEEQTTWDQIRRGQRLLNDCGARRVALVLAHRVRPR